VVLVDVDVVGVLLDGAVVVGPPLFKSVIVS
jgi:hypothetical protein